MDSDAVALSDSLSICPNKKKIVNLQYNTRASLTKTNQCK